MFEGLHTSQAVMEAMPVGIVVWRTAGQLEYANQSAATILGRQPSPGESPELVMARMVCAGARDPYPPERVICERTFRGETLSFRDAEFQHSSGERRAVEGWTMWFHDHDGQVDGAVTTFVNVTDVRRAEALRAGEARVLQQVAADTPLEETLATLASVFEAQADGMLASILLVEGGRVVRHVAAPSLPEGWARLVDGEPIGPNRGSCGTAAYAKEPVVVTDIATDPRWELYRDAALAFGFRACWSTPILDNAGDVLGTFAFYYSEPRAPTARLLELAAHGARLATVAIQSFRRKAALIGSVRDVTDQREELSERLRMATRAARIGVWCWDVRAERIEWDEQMYVLYGRVPDGQALSYDAWTGALHPDDRTRVEAALQAAVRGDQPFDTEFRVLWPDGTLRHVKVNAVVQIDEDGKPLRVVGTNWDITSAKAAEEDLRSAKEAAEAATRAKSVFIAGMSHEMRTPMNAILGYAQLLQSGASLDDEQRRTVEVIRSSGQRLLMLVNGVIDSAAANTDRPSTVLERKPHGEPPRDTDHQSLAALAAALPAELAAQLRDAALEARAGRLADLAKQVREHSSAAASQIENLAENFQYDIIAHALESRRNS